MDIEAQSEMNQDNKKAMSEEDEVDYDDEREEQVMLAGGGDSVGSTGHITKLFQGESLSAEEYALLRELRSREKNEQVFLKQDEANEAALINEMDDDDEDEDDDDELERMTPIGSALNDDQSPIKADADDDNEDDEVKELQMLLQQSKGFYQDDDGGFDQYEQEDFA